MFEPIQFINYLKYMGIGMLGVFIIVGIIIGATHLIAALTAPKSTEEDKYV